MAYMTYYYNMGYEVQTDIFFAYVDDGKTISHAIFQIDDTEEMCQYIKSGKMNHIDDTDGLENFLKERSIIGEEDIILLREELLW